MMNNLGFTGIPAELLWQLMGRQMPDGARWNYLQNIPNFGGLPGAAPGLPAAPGPGQPGPVPGLETGRIFPGGIAGLAWSNDAPGLGSNFIPKVRNQKRFAPGSFNNQAMRLSGVPLGNNNPGNGGQGAGLLGPGGSVNSPFPWFPRRLA